MKLLKSTFQIHLDKINQILGQGSFQANPAIWLYLNDLRTPFFMLEALAKIAEDVYDKKYFDELKDRFKIIEDGLGAIDHYVAFVRMFENDKNLSSELKSYLRQRAFESAEDLNYILEMNGWLNGLALDEIEKEFKKIKWKNVDKELEGIKKYYHKEIAESVEFAKTTKYHFDNVELDVHELRRKIRWLSIYPQALCGAIQYKTPSSKPTKTQLKYQTNAVVKSPYNIFPTAIAVDKPLLLDRNAFYALSYTIAELGNLKDEGLKIEALVEGFQNVHFMKEVEANIAAQKVLGKKQKTMQQILDEAEEICKSFFVEENLEKLLSEA